MAISMLDAKGTISRAADVSSDLLLPILLNGVTSAEEFIGRLAMGRVVVGILGGECAG